MDSLSGPTPTQRMGIPKKEEMKKNPKREREVHTKKLFDFVNIVLCVLRKIFKLTNSSNGCLPARHGDILDLNPFKLIYSRWVMVQHLPILDIVHTNLNFIQLVKDVSLGEGQGGVPIHLTREPEEGDVQPTTPPGPASSHSKL